MSLSVVAAVHSSRALDLQRVTLAEKIQREFLIKLCLFYGEEVRVATQQAKPVDDGVHIYELKKYWDGLILLVENHNETKSVHFHFRSTISQNALMSRQDPHHQVFDVVPPMHRQIIVTITRKNPSHSFTIGHDFQYVLSSQSSLKQSHLHKHKHWPSIDPSPSNDDIHVPQPIHSSRPK